MHCPKFICVEYYNILFILLCVCLFVHEKSSNQKLPFVTVFLNLSFVSLLSLYELQSVLLFLSAFKVILFIVVAREDLI